MSLHRLIHHHNLDPRGVDDYLRACQQADELDRPRDPEAILTTRRSWPSRFNPDGSYMTLRRDTTNMLEPYIPAPRPRHDEPPAPTLF